MLLPVGRGVIEAAITSQIQSEREEELYRLRRKALYQAVDRTYLGLLPVQWLFCCVFCLAQLSVGPVVPACAWHLDLWSGLVLGTMVNLVPAYLIRYRPGTRATRCVILPSQILLFALLITIAGGRFHAHLFVFVSLAFLTFYRDWQALVIVACADLAVQWCYGLMGCAGAAMPIGPQVQGLGEIAAWVALEAGVLAVVCVRGTQLLRTNARAAALLESERAQAALEREQYRALLESTSAVPWELDKRTGRCTYIGAQVKAQWGWEPARFQEDDFLFACLHPDDRLAFVRAIDEAHSAHDVVIECRLKLASNEQAHIRSFIRHAPMDSTHSIVRGISMDITAQRKLESELQQAQKLESIGRLAAGVAHEINTPVQFINDNCYFLRDAAVEVKAVLDAYRQAVKDTAGGLLDAAVALQRTQAAESAADMYFLEENIPIAVARSLEGLERVAAIVRAMKEFSHPNEDSPLLVDINAAIRSTLTVCRNEYKYVADVTTNLADVPEVACYVGALNQAFLNIIVNAAHAIAEANAGTDRRGVITISTALEPGCVMISIGDTGGGISEANRTKIFDPFFTTKEVGKGTGQGLAIARSVVVDKHGGTLTFDTQPGIGTTFYIRIPIHLEDQARDGAVAA